MAEKKYSGLNALSHFFAKLKPLIDAKVSKVEGKDLFSGKYNDLEGTPTLDGTDLKGALTKEDLGIAKASDVTQLQGDVANAEADILELQEAGYQTASDVDTAITKKGYQTAENVETAITGKGYQTASDVEDILSGKDYQTSTQVNETITSKGYQTASEVSQSIADAIKGISGVKYSVVEQLPDAGEAGTIYLVSNKKTEEQNIYDEYIWVETKFEKIGTTAVDLSEYLKSADLVEITNDEIDNLFV